MFNLMVDDMIVMDTVDHIKLPPIVETVCDSVDDDYKDKFLSDDVLPETKPTKTSKLLVANKNKSGEFIKCVVKNIPENIIRGFEQHQEDFSCEV